MTEPGLSGSLHEVTTLFFLLLISGQQMLMLGSDTTPYAFAQGGVNLRSVDSQLNVLGMLLG